ncbi:hypothetical protein B0A54_06108 [Friedmanniomyces endolithicus]|uniref:Uncharacterized protein n=1 Tax=Friedmanniomyces endolithicus TaxID=329885 RepID=A0A4V5NAW3_9PEZI|nr:hypothetical protein LTS09_006812 [Friedmanniomyces endolithicus]KAK0304371.1 hypothetical protein LTR01_007472 [Friedmanniomyces endolithicus]TKA43159.1 hypothetical protein B0A54_06108 [Friedmanniomyces endolithicus]
MVKSKPASRPTAASVRSSATANYRVRPSPLGQAQPRVQKSAAGAHLDVMLKAEAIKRLAPHATSSGSHSAPVTENAEGKRRAQEGSTELERTVQRFRERDADTDARLSGVQRAVSDLYGTMQALQTKLEGRVSVSMGTGQVIVYGEDQHLVQQRLAHLERENLELRQREAESQAQIAGLTERYNRTYHASQALEVKAQADTALPNQRSLFLMNKLAEAVVWNRAQYHHDFDSERDRVIEGWGETATSALDTGELDVVQLEAWLARMSSDMRKEYGGSGLVYLDMLVEGLHERQYGSIPDDVEIEAEEEEVEDEEDASEDDEEKEDDEGEDQQALYARLGIY